MELHGIIVERRYARSYQFNRSGCQMTPLYDRWWYARVYRQALTGIDVASTRSKDVP